MATLVLTTIGTVLGGPIGGAIGGLIGNAADAAIFKPQGREGPRLTDLNIQTSRYGSAIPRIFGAMRIAGTVIWSTDLKEATSTSGGGKGQPSVTSYSYSASFAVALSARPITGIGRIWADGNLLRGSAGDFKSSLGAFRLHNGASGQAVDPLIAAAVGIESAPAFRDMAYVVFEDLQLADFGNRIPSLTFEVTADDGAVTLSTVASALIGQSAAYLGVSEPALLGYAASGANAGDALAPLVEAYRLRWRFDGATVSLADTVVDGRILQVGQELRAVDGREEPLGTKRRTPLEQVPATLSVHHFDPARDYQIGVQVAERSGPGTRSATLDLPAALSADTARQLADTALRAQLRERRMLAKAFDWSTLDLETGDIVVVEGEAGDWLVEQLEWDNMAPRLTLRAHATNAVMPPAAGDAGQPVRQYDLAQGPTSLAAIELPPLDETLAQTPLVYAAATGADAGWRRAALMRYWPETSSAETIGGTAPRAVIGTALTALPPGEPWMIDGRNQVDIALVNSADSLTAADDDELVRGTNLCMLGAELLQFGRVEALGAGQYRLSRLIRGWHGTEWAQDGHVVGEPFVLVDKARLTPIVMTPADVGAMVDLRASGTGDATPAEATRLVDGRAILPPSPVHGAASNGSGGDLLLSWTRRSRLGWLWRDLGEAPLAEEREAYQVTIMAGADTLRQVEVGSANWTYLAADRTSDLVVAGATPMTLEVRQIGTYGPSEPLRIPLS